MSLATKVFSGSLFQLGIQLINRLIGLISTLLLARLLVPEDFGLVAIVMLVIHFFETLADAGTHQYLIQKSQIIPADLNTAFSLDLLIKGLITVAMIPGAWVVSAWYKQPDLYPALLMGSIAMLARAAKNPGYSILVREIDYARIFKLTFVQKISGFAITISWAVLTPSFWALIAGELISTLVFTLGTYHIHAFRPQWSLSQLKEQWHFSQWSLLRGTVGFTRSHLDTLLVSRLFTPAELGSYHVQRDLAVMPSIMVILPTLEPFLAAMAKSKQDTNLFAFRFRVAFLLLVTILLPITSIMWHFSEGLTQLVLGDQWVPHHELLKYFSLLFITYSVFALIADSFVALGLIRPLFIFDLLSTLVLATILLSFNAVSLNDFALYRGLIGVVITGAVLMYLNKLHPIHLKRIIGLLIPAFLAMFLSQYITENLLSWQTNSILYAITGSTLFALLYALILFAFYRATWRLNIHDEIRSLYHFFDKLNPFRTAQHRRSLK